jgi:hypothetical protein
MKIKARLYTRLFCLLGSMFLFCAAYTQTTKITGKVIDAETKEPLPFVNLAFKDSKIGTATDINGNYSIETYYVTDSLICSFLGYDKQVKKVKKDVAQVMNFELVPAKVQLEAVEIVGSKKDENPAHEIFRNVIRNKKINNREKLEAYQYEAYNKVEFDLNNITEEFKKKKVFKPFDFIFENVDSSEAKPFLPMFLTEAISDFYYRKNPKSDKEVIKATKISGIQNESVSQFLGDMYQNVNIYDNYILVFDKSFISPIADFGLLTYKYYLLDSGYIDNKYWCYKIRFMPRRKQELTFIGDMWIHDTTYAVKRVEATMAEDANINFINEFTVVQDYDQVDKEVWMLVKDKLVIDFTISNNAVGFYGRKTSTYRNFVINSPKPDDFYFGAENIIVADSADLRTEDFWNSARHENLSAKEMGIYKMIDTIQKVPVFRTYIDIVQLFLTGYKVWGNFELGPYFTFFSFNRVEGNRLRIGGRTSNEFSTRLMLEGYIAYGLKDQNFKYGGGFTFALTKKPWQIIGANYKKDVEQLGQGLNAWRQDNILASVFRRSPSIKLNGFEEVYGFYEKEWFQGLSNRVSFSHRRIWPLTETLQFNYFQPDGSLGIKPDITSFELGFYTRFAYKEKYVTGEFERISLGTNYPIIQLNYTHGFKNVLGSGYDYDRVVAIISDRLRFNPFGYMDVMLEAGKFFGKLPYPLLELHKGNETFSYDASAFNLMNFYEFVSDEYASLSVSHHFNGFFLNKVPLLRKLKWREIALFKGVMGSFSPMNSEQLNFPVGLSTLNKPYFESGVGVENILKVLRVDLLWRMAYTNDEYVSFYEQNPFGTKIPRFGIRGTLQIIF